MIDIYGEETGPKLKTPWAASLILFFHLTGFFCLLFFILDFGLLSPLEHLPPGSFSDENPASVWTWQYGCEL